MSGWVATFNARLDALPPEFDDEKPWHLLEQGPVASAAELASVEASLGFALPAMLRELLSTEGPIQSADFADAWQTMQLLDVDELRRQPLGLAAFIDTYWGGRPELELALTREELKTINESTAVFGLRHLNDNAHEYFFFDRDGRIGTVMLDQDAMDGAIDQLRDIANGRFDAETLDALLARQCDAMINGLQDLL